MATPDLLDDAAADAALDETIEQLESEATDADVETALSDAESVDDAAAVLVDDDDQEASADADDGHHGSSEPDPSGSSENPSVEDVNVEEIELSDDDFGEGGLFSGVEGADGDGDDDDESSRSGDEQPGEESSADDLFDMSGSSNSGKLQETINEGAARLAVVGLDEGDEKDALETEFVDVFASFRLGYYGSEFANKYLFAPADGDVDPAWAMLGTVLVCAAFSVAMRPDTDEQIARMKGVVGNIGGTSPDADRDKAGALA